MFHYIRTLCWGTWCKWYNVELLLMAPKMVAVHKMLNERLSVHPWVAYASHWVIKKEIKFIASFFWLKNNPTLGSHWVIAWSGLHALQLMEDCDFWPSSTVETTAANISDLILIQIVTIKLEVQNNLHSFRWCLYMLKRKEGLQQLVFSLLP